MKQNNRLLIVVQPQQLGLQRTAVWPLLLLVSLSCLLDGIPSFSFVARRTSRPRSSSTRKSSYDISSQYTDNPKEDKDQCATTSILPSPQQQDDASAIISTFVMATGRAAFMLQRAPVLCGHSVCLHWSDNATHALERAVDHFVQHHPIVTGKAHLQTTTTTTTSLVIDHLGSTSPKLQVDRIIRNDQWNSSSLEFSTPETILSLMDRVEGKQTKNEDALFGVHLLELPDNRAIITVKFSHSLGDGHTFFEVVKYLSMVMSSEDKDPCVPIIDWTNPVKETHQLYPSYFSDRDVEVAYGLPFLIGCARNILSSLPEPNIIRPAQYLLLDKRKVNSIKRQIRDTLQRSDISANDIITAALIDANNNTDVAVITENQRTSLGLSALAAGNLYTEVALPRLEGVRPDHFRDYLVQSDQGTGTWGQLPLRPFLEGKHCRISSLATIAKSFVYRDIQVLCTFPDPSIVSNLPIDVAMIFRYNNEYWGILHNFPSIDTEHSELRNLLASPPPL